MPADEHIPIGIPAALAALFQTLAHDGRAPAYIRLDALARIVDWGGATGHYGLSQLAVDHPAASVVPFLEGLVPVDAGSLSLRSLNLSDQVTADAHLFHDGAWTWVLLLDSTDEARSRQHFQQIGNEIALDRERLARRVRELEAELNALRNK